MVSALLFYLASPLRAICALAMCVYLRYVYSCVRLLQYCCAFSLFFPHFSNVACVLFVKTVCDFFSFSSFLHA